MLKNVIYDRSKRAYGVFCPQTGELLQQFPNGKIGRKLAFQCAVQIHSEELYSVVTGWLGTYPQLESRAWKAAEIIVNGGVMPSFDQSSIATIESQSSEYGDHELVRVENMILCPCADHDVAPLTGQTFQRYCKHVLAYLFTVQSYNDAKQMAFEDFDQLMRSAETAIALNV